MIIKIKNLKLKTIIGIHDWEMSVDRDIVINISISTKYDKSVFSDDIKDAIDYEMIANKIRNFISTKKFKLVESMAGAILDIIMEDERIDHCELTIDKIGAIKDIESFSVTISKNKNGS